MKVVCGVTLLLTVAVAYYIYIPLPGTISEPWKLMLLGAAFRTVTKLGDIAHGLGVSHHIRVINKAITGFERLVPVSVEGARIHDDVFAGVHVRVYEPTRGPEGELRRGVVFIHGGGWSLGTPKLGSYDILCRKMADELNAVIVSVDYLLAPDARFPKQHDDCLWASRHFLRPEVLAQYSVDAKRVAVSGDSAGGNLAAAVAQQVATDDSISVKFRAQALIYPVLQALDFNTPSYQQNQDVPILYRTLMARYWLEYLDADLSLIPSMLVNNHTAQDQSRAFAHRATKLDWTALLPATVQKHYKPVVQTTGSPRIVEEVPGLLDVRAAPLLAEREVLARAPPAYILTCEHDVLRDDGLMYARRLQEAGVPVVNDHYGDGFHGCVSFAFWPLEFSVGVRALRNYIAWLDENL